MNTEHIMVKTYELIDAIKASENFCAFRNYENKVLNDPEIKVLLEDFHKAKQKFEEAYPYKKYYPNFSQVLNQYQKSKINLMNNKVFKTYKANEKEIELYINEIEFKLKNLVHIKEKHGKININYK